MLNRSSHDKQHSRTMSASLNFDRMDHNIKTIPEIHQLSKSHRFEERSVNISQRSHRSTSNSKDFSQQFSTTPRFGDAFLTKFNCN